MKKLVIVWPGFTGYMGACWRALAQLACVKIFIEPSRYEQRFDGSDLAGLDWMRVEDEAARQAAMDRIRAFGPDLVVVCGWSTPLSRAVGQEKFGCRKVLAFDMPWEWTLRKIAARLVLWRRLRKFDAAFIPGARCARYARWLGFTEIVTGSNPSGWERFKDVRPSPRGFVYVGRRAPEKGLDVLEAAYSRYRQQVDDPWPLDLVGGETFVKPEEMPSVLSRHACLVLPSRWEPWGIAAAEAMCAGLATIMSEACGLVADVTPTRVVRTGDVADLTRAMVEVHRMSLADREAAATEAKRKMADYSSANWAKRVLGLANGTRALVASFWEEHCLECAMPLCYGKCAMFERGWHGRCVRVESELKSRVEVEERWGGFVESVRGEGMVRFRRWGKIELMYHGAMIGERGAARLEWWNLRLGWLWRRLGKYHRAIRWRLAAMCGRKGVPQVWRLCLEGERDERLCATIAYEDGREVLREPLQLESGVTRSFEFGLPRVEKGALFRIFPMNGEATGEIRFVENRVEAESGGVVEVESRSRTADQIKCVAWDLDGTLWDGTLSEGEDVRLREGVLETIKALDAAGIVNSICSKNNYDVAIAKLKELGLEEYFVFPQIGWGAKSAAIKNLAREMNIGLDAIAFVDDREENRADVRENCPGVLVLDEIAAVALRLGWRSEKGLGAARRKMYREEMARRGAAQAFAGDAAAFLAQSELNVELCEVDFARCLELVNRTNQLTITGRRYAAADFTALMKCCQTRAVRVRDKYGDYGIVGFVAWDDLRIVEFVFSCRVACKGVERRVLEMLPQGLGIEVAETARNAPIREIVAEWQEAHR